MPAPSTRQASAGVSRTLNAAALLRLALGQDVVTANDAISSIGLTRTTVLTIFDELVRAGWLAEIEDSRAAGEYSKGRPARRYALSPHAGIVVGIDAGDHRLKVCAASLRGEQLARRERTESRDATAEQRRQSLQELVSDVLDDAGRSRGEILQTVIGVPAPVDLDGRSPDDDEGYWARMNPHLTDLPGLGQVVVDNDANLAAVAERSRGGVASDSYAALLSGERFGAGIVLDGRPLRGSHGGAGELRALNHVAGVGTPAGLAASARTLYRDALRSRSADDTSPVGPGPQLSAEQILEAAAGNDPVAAHVVAELGVRLARVVELLDSLLGLDQVVVSGAIAASAGAVIERAREVLATEKSASFPTVTASTLGEDVVLFGAVDLAVARVREQPFDYRALS